MPETGNGNYSLIFMTENNIKKETLSIRISTNGFCFCSYTPEVPDSLKVFNYTPEEDCSLASNIRTAIERCPLIKEKGIYDIKAIIETGEYTCIPTEHDIPGEYKQYFHYCFPKNKDAEIIPNKLNAQGYTILFPVENSVYEEINKLGNVTFYTPASIILGYLGYKPMPEERYMFAYLYNELALIISMKNGKAEITNIFRKDDYANTLFYLLSIWKEQELSQTNDTLYLCGDSSIENFSLQAAQFIKNIKRINPNELFMPSLLNRIGGIPFDLQALILCE